MWSIGSDWLRILTRGLGMWLVHDHQELHSRSDHGVTVCVCVLNHQNHHKLVHFREWTGTLKSGIKISGGSNGRMRDTPWGLNSFNFMQFFGEFWQNRTLAPPSPMESWRTQLGEILDPPLKISHYLMQLRLTYISAIFNLMKFDSYSRFSIFSPCSRFSSFVHIQDSLPLAHTQDSHLLCMFKNFISSCYFLSTRKSFHWEHTISKIH